MMGKKEVEKSLNLYWSLHTCFVEYFAGIMDVHIESYAQQ